MTDASVDWAICLKKGFLDPVSGAGPVDMPVVGGLATRGPVCDRFGGAKGGIGGATGGGVRSLGNS